MSLAETRLLVLLPVHSVISGEVTVKDQGRHQLRIRSPLSLCPEPLLLAPPDGLSKVVPSLMVPLFLNGQYVLFLRLISLGEFVIPSASGRDAAAPAGSCTQEGLWVPGREKWSK